MRYLWMIGTLVTAVLLGAPPARSDANESFAEGQRLFNEKKFEAALEQFKEADALVPNEPRVYSWIAACLNELGQYAEAEKRLVRALEIIRESQKQDASKLVTVPPIDVGYFQLLSLIQTNLHEFEKARNTLETYTFPDDGSEDAKKTKQALEASKQTVRARMVAIGTDCVRAGDLECGRKALTQAEAIQKANSSLRESLARDAVVRADREPGATDEEKANRAKQFESAVKVTRFWLEEAPNSPDAQRLLAKALAGGRTKEGCEEATRVLTALWSASTDPAKRDSTIQLDLAVAYSCLEHWEQASAAASSFIELNPTDPRGQGYCLRSFAQFQLGHCPETIEDGARCKNADGTARQLKHVEVCQQHLDKQDENKKLADEQRERAALQQRCSHLYERVKWARSPIGDIALGDLVDVLDDLQKSEAQCRSFMEAAEKEYSGKSFTSPVPAMCASGAKIASYPYNLSSRTKDDLEGLRAQTLQLKKLCKSSWDATQAASVESGLKIIEQALARL
jgi:tetratricopeptide (TPR) repeat protein